MFTQTLDYSKLIVDWIKYVIQDTLECTILLYTTRSFGIVHIYCTQYGLHECHLSVHVYAARYSAVVPVHAKYSLLGYATKSCLLKQVKWEKSVVSIAWARAEKKFCGGEGENYREYTFFSEEDDLSWQYYFFEEHNAINNDNLFQVTYFDNNSTSSLIHKYRLN